MAITEKIVIFISILWSFQFVLLHGHLDLYFVVGLCFVVCFMRTIMGVCCVVLLILNVGGFLNILYLCCSYFRGNFIDIGIKKRKGK